MEVTVDKLLETLNLIGKAQQQASKVRPRNTREEKLLEAIDELAGAYKKTVESIIKERVNESNSTV